MHPVRAAMGAACLLLTLCACDIGNAPSNQKLMGNDILSLPAPPADARYSYGPGEFQFGDLRLPKTAGPHPVAIVIHGGYWRAAYNLDHAGQLSAALARAGVAAWSLEYRRTGNSGGGWPGTFDDIVHGAEYLRTIAVRHHLDLANVVAVGHSAGGQLALWLAGQRKVPLRGVVSLAGVSDLRRAFELRLSGNAVVELLGGTPAEVPDRYDKASPIELLPLGVPQRLVHGVTDPVVPFEMSEKYRKAASAAGDDAKLVALPGAGHFELINPRSKEWREVEAVVKDLLNVR